MYITYSRIEGSITEIDSFRTEKEARRAVQGYYAQDRKMDCFEDGVYGYAKEGEPQGVDGIVMADPDAAEVSRVMSALGRRGKGVPKPKSAESLIKARAAVSPERRAEILRKARAEKAAKAAAKKA